MKKLVVVLGVVVVAALVAVAVLGGRALVLRRAESTVGYLGDSITDQARTNLEDDLHADPDKIKAVGGIRIEEMAVPAKDLEALHPQQVVINLGTNNVLAVNPVDQEQAALQGLLDTFPDARCIHLVTINEHMVSSPGRDLQTGARQLNDRIHAMAAADPRLRVIDWAKIVNDYDAAGDPNGPVTNDTVHPAAAGEQLLLDAYRSSIESC